ncbi:MAG: collagen-like protein [Prochloraceae cyanobacterium]|nr:collagen-like protein [Prochloraceae cyanobacterium]
MYSLRSLKLLSVFPIAIALLGTSPILAGERRSPQAHSFHGGVTVTKIALERNSNLNEPVVCQKSTLVDATIASYFGNTGRFGIDGAKGRNGERGSDFTIFAAGEAIDLDLSGKDGGDGQDGSNGHHAICYGSFYNNHNIYGASGGNGGNGGDGGDGGDGGQLTVYYNNLEDLKQIYVQALGGKGGDPGRGGYGGRGCRCAFFTWTRRVCRRIRGYRGYRCYLYTYYCRNGRDGIQGRDGQRGRDGRLGRLKLINGSELLAEDRPTAEVNLSQLQDRTILLSRNIWQTKNGARLLLASGSEIDDRYFEFVERLEKNFELVWSAKQPLTGLGEENLTVTLENNRQIKVVSPEDVWLAGTISELEEKTQYIVAAVVRRSEVTKLTRADFTGNKSDLNFVLVDRANKSDFLETEFEITYRTTKDSDRFDRNPNYKTRYQGKIPSELVRRDRNRFVLNIGKLPIEEKFLRSGVPIEIELVITRSLGARSAQQIFNWKGVIK